MPAKDAIHDAVKNALIKDGCSMDKLNAYRNTIKRLIAARADMANRAGGGVADHFTPFDDERGLYLLVKAGWPRGHRARGATLFIRLIDGKIWIEEDWTEDGIANELVGAGIPREDIVLGFHPPHVRPRTEFATA